MGRENNFNINGNITLDGTATATIPSASNTKFIDYIELYAASAGGGGVKVDLVSVGMVSAADPDALTFQTTLTDGDGDSASATLTVNLTGVDDAPVLVVGSSGDDDTGSTNSHVVPTLLGPTMGEIDGGYGHDILIGDPGGSQLAFGQTVNIAMVLDTSGSMSDPISFNSGTVTRIAALKQATIAALQDLTETGAEYIRVNLTEFNAHSASLGTYDLIVDGAVNTTALNQAIAAINALNPHGGTNYEAGLGAAAAWIHSTARITSYTATDHNLATGSGNDDDAALLRGADGTAYALVSGWGPSVADLRDVRGNTADGWGVEGSGNNLDNDEVLRFDFGPGTDFDNSGNFTPAGFNGPLVSQATYVLRNFGSGSHQVNYTATYSNGTVVTEAVAFAGNDAHTFTIAAAAGLTIDHVAFWVPTGQDDGYVDLESVKLAAGGPIANADVNTVLFISDGEPTYHYVGDGTDQLGGNGSDYDVNTIPNITGSGNNDTVSEVSLITGAGFHIQAVGISVGETALDVLDQVEGQPAGSPGSHAADNIGTAEELTEVIGEITGGGTELDTAGSDTLHGGEGNDIIFGDAPFTDILAQAQGLSTAPGAGWQVFQQLEAGQGADATWGRADTIAYIQGQLLELSQESGRSGGDDILVGGAGDDFIFGQEGDDRISGGLGNDMLSGGSGSDTFVFQSEDVGHGVDTIADFHLDTPTVGGDVLNIADLLAGAGISEATFNDNPGDYLVVTTTGTDTTVAFDATGGAGAHLDAVQIATLQNVSTTLDTLIANNQVEIHTG